MAILSVWQGIARLRLDQEIVRDSLRQSAFAAASDELNIFVSAEQILRTVASEDEIRSGRQGCRTRMREAIAGTKFLPNMLRVSANGRLLCSAVGNESPADGSVIPKQDWWGNAALAPDFTLSEGVYSPASKHRVIYGVLPVADGKGQPDGAVAVAIDVDWLAYVQSQKRVPAGAVVALFNKTGRVIASNDAAIAQQIFAKGLTAAHGEDGLLTAPDASGERWSFAMAPVIRRDYYVGFSMKSSHLFRFTYVHVTVDLLLPVLMIAMASLAIWSVTNRLVVSSIELLQRTATAYAKGHYAVRPLALTQTPGEFRALGAALVNMAQAVQERDKKLREALDQKALLIKEIHHRVKNSLQIVMSLTSLQASRLRDPAARDAIEQTRTRVNALALVHRMIYELDLDGTVDVKALLGDVVAQLHQGLSDDRRGISVTLDVMPYRTLADSAIPLTLFVVEAVTNAFKHGFEKGRSGTLALTLAPSGPDKLKLTIEDDGKGVNLEAEPSELGTGARLMSAFANQLGGQVSTRRREPGGTVVELVFPKVVADDASLPRAAQ